MPKLVDELRERLLRAGVAPRHVRRYVGELSDHLADLTAEEERAGRSRRDAAAAAMARLGNADDLASAMIVKPELRAWSARAPWAVFGAGPLLLLGMTYFVSCFILWSGWKMFLPGAVTPFGGHAKDAMYGLQNLYFQTGRMIYFTAPILVGWGMGLIAARQRVKAGWMALGLALIAWIGSTAQIQASREAVPGGFGHIRMVFFVPTHFDQDVFGAVAYLAAILLVGALPYLVWRWQRAFAHSRE